MKGAARTEAGAQPALRALSGPLSLRLSTLGVGTGRHVIHNFAVAGLTPAAPADDAALEAHRLLTLRRPAEAREVAPADASPLLKATLAMELGGPCPRSGSRPKSVSTGYTRPWTSGSPPCARR